VITGRHVVLRPVEDEDLPVILRWQNHPEVWWHMDYERPFSLEDVREELTQTRLEGQAFIITVESRPIGRIGLNRFRRRDRICSLYVYLGEAESQGRGHARDAVMTMLSYGFDRLDLHQVEVSTLAANVRGLHLFGTCGFVREATLRDRSFKDGRWVDHVVLSVNRAEFIEARESWAGTP
jgi:RimJ/RimL family protein N-acetyltransferase